MKRCCIFAVLLAASVLLNAEALTAGGNIKAETIYALPDWDSGFEDSRSGSGVKGLLYFSYEPSEKIRARGEIGYSYQTGYANPLGRYEAMGLPPVVDQSFIQGADYRQELYIPQLWAEYSFGNGFVTLGKQPLGWGSCWFMNPTDKSGAAAGLEALNDDTVIGIPGARVEWLAKGNASFEAYLFFSDTAETGTVALEDGNPMNLPFGAKASYVFDTAEASLGLAKAVYAESAAYRREFFLLGDASLFAGDAVLNAEISLKLPTNDAGTAWASDWDIAESLAAGAGCNYRIEAAETDVLAEYYFFGSGDDPGEYDASRILADGGLLLGRHYLLLRGSRDMSDSVNLAATGLANLLDGGGLGVLEFEWAPVMDSVFNCTVMLPWGDGDSEMGGEADLIPGLLSNKVWDSFLISCSYMLYF